MENQSSHDYFRGEEYQEGFSQPEFPEKIEIPPETRERLELIARIVGGDFGMKVDFADRPGIGSVFNAAEMKITFDPQQVVENPREAEFVAAHEGGHRAISRSPDQIGVKQEKIEELYDLPGFGFLARSVEEPADNEWIKRKFEGIREHMEEVLRVLHRHEEDEAPVLTDPDVLETIALLGYTPKFVFYGPQIERHWLMGEFSRDLDPDVRRVLEKTIKSAEKAYLSLPGPHPTEKQIKEKARQRFSITLKEVWPAFKKLVEQDISREKIREMIEEMMKQSFANMREALEKGESLPGPLGELPQEFQDELREKMKQGIDNLEKFMEEQKQQAGGKEKAEKREKDEAKEGEAGEEGGEERDESEERGNEEEALESAR